MAKTNKEIVLDCIEQVFNQKRLDLLDDYYSPDYTSHSPPYVGIGLFPDTFSIPGKFLVLHVAPEGPAYGKIQPGDEIISITEGEKDWHTFDELKAGLWGQGVKGGELTFRVRRKDQEAEYQIIRSVIESFDTSWSISKDDLRHFLTEECPDYKITCCIVLEAGDMVVVYGYNTGFMKEFNRSVLFAECDLYRLRDGKIVETWEVADTYALHQQEGYRIEPPEKAPAP